MTRHKRALFLLVALCGAGCDQGSKWAAVEALTEVNALSGFLLRAHPVVDRVLAVHPDFFHIRYAENPGMAFGLLRDASYGRGFLLLSTSLGLLLMLALARRTSDPLVLCGWALIWGGGLGNLIDRARLGYVIDFVSWHYHDHFIWPTFNVADALIFIGAVLLFLRRNVGVPPATTATTLPGAGQHG